MDFVYVLLFLVDPLGQYGYWHLLALTLEYLAPHGIQILSMYEVQIEGIDELPIIMYELPGIKKFSKILIF